MATNEENLTPQSLVLPDLSGSSLKTDVNNPRGLIAISGAHLAYFDGTAWFEIIGT